MLMLEEKYYGHYRAKIVALNKDLKNGIYKVRVYPFMADVEEDYLPYAESTMTVRFQHIQLKVDDMVWVFFEGGDPHYPVINDLCNFKDSYPKPVLGEEGTYDKWQFGDENELTVEYDEKNKILKLILDTDTTVLLDAKNKKIDIKDANSNQVTMDNTGIDIKGPGSSEVKMTSSGIELKGSTKKITGAVAPTGSGPFCALPACLFTGAPHVGDTST